MQYGDEDLGEFNDSTVFFQPAKFNSKAVPTLTKHHNPETGNLGVYQPIKLSPLLDKKAGELVQLIRLDGQSLNSFVTNEAMQLLEQYSTDELCFVVVVGNQGAGKSFFCDKILNLAEIRGNHFCRKKTKGIHIWSSPFVKDDLKIFLLEISNCDLNSQEFKILMTYALLIGSAFISLDQLSSRKQSIEELDQVLSEVVEKITPSQIQRGSSKGSSHRQNSQVFMPKIFFNLHRTSQARAVEGLRMVPFYATEMLPDALEKGYVGSSADLIHLPFLDTKCIKEEYMRRTAQIFREVYGRATEKRYKELVLNGNIIAKVVKYIETYLNNKYELSIEDLYVKVIEDLYQSAYNFCILSYHEQMQRELADEHPKSLEALLAIFEVISDNTLDKFQEFNLDEKLYHVYYDRLEQHISEKEQMILEINAHKTQQTMMQFYDESQIGDIQYYRSLNNRIDRDHPDLNHGKADIIAKINASFYQRTKSSNNIEFQIMKEIEAIKLSVSQKRAELSHHSAINEQKYQQRSRLSQEQEQHRKEAQSLNGKVKLLGNQISQAIAAGNLNPSEQRNEEARLRGKIASNQQLIEQLKTGKVKDQRVTAVENRVEQLGKQIQMQEKLLRELKESDAKTDPPVKENKLGRSLKRIEK